MSPPCPLHTCAGPPIITWWEDGGALRSVSPTCPCTRPLTHTHCTLWHQTLFTLILHWWWRRSWCDNAVVTAFSQSAYFVYTQYTHCWLRILHLSIGTHRPRGSGIRLSVYDRWRMPYHLSDRCCCWGSAHHHSCVRCNCSCNCEDVLWGCPSGRSGSYKVALGATPLKKTNQTQVPQLVKVMLRYKYRLHYKNFNNYNYMQDIHNHNDTSITYCEGATVQCLFSSTTHRRSTFFLTSHLQK